MDLYNISDDFLTITFFILTPTRYRSIALTSPLKSDRYGWQCQWSTFELYWFPGSEI
jgi:hypothetical protein